MHVLSWREEDFPGVVVAGLVSGYVMAIAGLWAGRVPGLVAVDIADFGRRYMVSDRPSAWLFGLVSHLANSVVLALGWACVLDPLLGRLKALLEAASAFEDSRLPELFCGFQRASGPPVPYEKANVPQAWAAAAPVLAVQLLLRLLPHVPRGRIHCSPWLPDWLESLEVEGVPVAGGGLDVSVRHDAGGALVTRARHPSLEVVVGEAPPAPLWGAPEP